MQSAPGVDCKFGPSGNLLFPTCPEYDNEAAIVNDKNVSTDSIVFILFPLIERHLRRPVETSAHIADLYFGYRSL